jgi:maltooligosyltrehalose trehalohydrolase
VIPRVWAPDRTSVHLVTAEHRQPLRPDGDGWWVGDTPLAPGTRYAYSLDGGPPRPDPRSRSQPDGVGGHSAVVDHDSFSWTDHTWRGTPLAGAVLYELHVGTFSPAGTFDGAIERLDHLVELGVTLIEVMPVAEFAGERGWGYDGVLPYAVHHAYGGPDACKRFVDAAHRRGLGVLLDVVYNHFGPAGNYLQEFGPYTHEAAVATPWGQAVNLDGPGSDEVRAYLLDNLRSWLVHFHMDGVRIDATHTLVDRRPRHVLAEMARAATAVGASEQRTIVLIAEDERNDPRLTRPEEAGGYGLDGQWSDDLHHALHAVLTGEHEGYYVDYGSIEAITRALGVIHHLDGRPSRHRGRAHGAPVGPVPRHRFVVATQNHDQVGNRACGERLVHLVGADAAKVAAGLVLLGPCTPLLFQGEEWGASSPFTYFADFEDEALRSAVRDGRRREFASLGHEEGGGRAVPDPFAPETFAACRLRWDELNEAGHGELLAWYRDVLTLRRREPDLADPDPDTTHVERDGEAVLMQRGSLAVVANLGTEARRMTAIPVAGHETAILLSSRPGATAASGVLSVPPRSLVVLRGHVTSGSAARHG